MFTYFLILMTRRAFLGTGLIGSGMAEAAVARGDEVLLWNRTRSKAEELQGALDGEDALVRVVDAPQDALEADYVHIALTSDDAVDATLDALGVASFTAEQKARVRLVDHSTCSAEGTAARQKRLSEAGVFFLSAPVFMSPAACRACTGVMLVGGEKAHVDAAESALEVMTGKLLFVGEEPGRAATVKLVGNGMILGLVGSLADVFAVGAPSGVTPQDALSLFEAFDLNYIFQGRGARMAEGDFEPAWTLRMARKDLGLMLDAATEETPVLTSLAARADELIDAGHGERDVAVLAAPITEKT